MIRNPSTSILIIILVCLLCATGCTSPFEPASQTNETPAVSPVPASYQVTIAQPDDRAKIIKMDTDVYNPGEVVEFYLVNEGPGTLTCPGDPPAFSVIFQTGSGTWATKMGTGTPDETNKTSLERGIAGPVSRFVTTGWEPNRYRIVSDCGVSREFLLRPPPTPVPPLCQRTENASLWVRINPIGDQYASTRFTIRGTTNRAAGEELRYLVFPAGTLPANLTAADEKPLSAKVEEGTCGENTWSVDLEVPTAQEYYIMISAGTPDATAIRRFMVLSIPPP